VELAAPLAASVTDERELEAAGFVGVADLLSVLRSVSLAADSCATAEAASAPEARKMTTNRWRLLGCVFILKYIAMAARPGPQVFRRSRCQ
jgi:hypothetical protein